MSHEMTVAFSGHPLKQPCEWSDDEHYYPARHCLIMITLMPDMCGQRAMQLACKLGSQPETHSYTLSNLLKQTGPQPEGMRLQILAG
jgi:hypothetical protein